MEPTGFAADKRVATGHDGDDERTADGATYFVEFRTF
jgi:hypothetical protein